MSDASFWLTAQVIDKHVRRARELALLLREQDAPEADWARAMGAWDALQELRDELHAMRRREEARHG